MAKISYAPFVASLFILTASITAFVYPKTASAHEINAAVMDVEFKEAPTQLFAVIEMNLEAFVAGIGPEHSDTNDSPEAALYRQYRKLPPDELAAAFEPLAAQFADNISVVTDGMTFPTSIEPPAIPAVGDVEEVRFSRINITANIPEGVLDVQVGWSAMMGQIIVRTADGKNGGYAAMLSGGQLSAPLSVAGSANEGIRDRIISFLGTSIGIALISVFACGISLGGFWLWKRSSPQKR